ncbi:MAG: helix-turn-helix transcriptional regulator [Taibaiella sp.]|nr:helix-turn-helix transcriptional regulator [Taibaiella sp.]
MKNITTVLRELRSERRRTQEYMASKLGISQSQYNKIEKGEKPLGLYKSCTVDLGVVGGKTTKIKNEEIFTERKAKKLYGIKHGDHKIDDYGINFQVNAPPVAVYKKNVGWELNGVVFADKDSLGSTKRWTVSLNNAFHFIFLKHMRLTWRVQANYDNRIQKYFYLANQISIGFYINNHF